MPEEAPSNRVQLKCKASRLTMQNHESKTRRSRPHDGHMAEKEFKCELHFFHCRMVHKPISIKHAMKILVPKVAVDEERNDLEQLPAWSVKETKSRADGDQQAEGGGRNVRVASLMDLCHLKHAELCKHHTHEAPLLRDLASKRNTPRSGHGYHLTEARNVGTNFIHDPVFSLKQNPFRHPLGGHLWERKLQEEKKSCCKLGIMYFVGNSSSFTKKCKCSSPSYVDDFNSVGRIHFLKTSRQEERFTFIAPQWF